MGAKILWADDEIALLKPHLMFLENKGYEVKAVTSGNDALDEADETHFDIIFLDENMPGLTGLETLKKLKERHPHTPVVMITKSEEESIMEDAIGSKIADYLIKPVNPNQILLSLRKNLDGKSLQSTSALNSYRSEFAQMSMDLSDCRDISDWMEMYKRLVKWDLSLQNVSDEGMQQVFQMQIKEANGLFAKYIGKEYVDWLQNPDEDTPLLSHTVFKSKILPEIKEAKGTTHLLVIDNLRFDQWKVLSEPIAELFTVSSEDMYSSILPTATQYARNAFFAGLMPTEIQKLYPQFWKGEHDEGSKNQFEQELLDKQLSRLGYKGNMTYTKITNLDAAHKMVDNFSNSKNYNLNVVVYNFVDMLSHARSDMEVIKELADDEAAYRSLTKSWFNNSPLYDFVKKVAQSGDKLIITTDHGTVKVKEASKVVGDRNVNTNLRYKLGKNLNYTAKDVFAVAKPEDIFLPKENLSTEYIFAKEEKFFVYPNNYNRFVSMFTNTFQHGGISLEEMLIPLVVLQPKGK